MEPLKENEQDIKKDKEICVELLSNKNNKFLTYLKIKKNPYLFHQYSMME